MRSCVQVRLALALSLAAIARGQNGKGVTALSASDAQGEAERIAIVVGVSEYSRESGLENLPMAKNDAEDVAAALEKLGYIVSRLPNATAGSIVRSIRESRKLITGTNSTVIFYYSGHGTASPNHENYLMTYGASRERMENEGLGLTELQKELRNTKAQRQVIWIDACRTVPVEGRRSAADADMFAEMQAASGIRILLAASFGEASWEYPELKHGAFTYQLLKGLEPGSPAYREDGGITFSGLSRYVRSETRKWTFEHHHTQVPVESGADVTGDFLLASFHPAVGIREDTKEALRLAMEALNRKDYAVARSRFEALALKNDPEAEYRLSLLYFSGFGVSRDLGECAKWLHAAAEQNHTEAQAQLGWMYRDGYGVPQNYAEARRLLQLAADKGVGMALGHLGIIYVKALGVPQDDIEAVRLFRLAADRDNFFGQYNLGFMYENGRGVTKSAPEAIKWYRLAAAQGYVEAKKALERLGATSPTP